MNSSIHSASPSRAAAFIASAAIAGLSTLAACSSESVTTPITDGLLGRVAYTTRAPGQPALFVTDLTSTATRLHLADVADPIPGNDQSLFVDDAHLLALGSPAWNGSASRIAVVASIAYDQSEIVIVDAYGSGAVVASPNTQIIASDPAWSVDDSKLAYTMSTLPNFGGIDLFVTDLAAHTVRRLTTGARMANATVRWIGAENIYGSRTAGFNSSGPDNYLSDVLRIDPATGAIQTVATGLVGLVTDISADGRRVLLTRNTGVSQALYEVTLGGGERQLAKSDVSFARYVAPVGQHVLVANNVGTDARTFDLLDPVSGHRTRIVGPPSDADAAFAELFAIDDVTRS